MDQHSNLGHQPPLPPANWCPTFAPRTTTQGADSESKLVMKAAKEWFDNEGPLAGTNAMLPSQAFQNSENDWAVRYTLLPDTGETFFERFSFARASGSSPALIRRGPGQPGQPVFEVVAVSAEVPEEIEREQEMDTICRLGSLKDFILAELQVKAATIRPHLLVGSPHSLVPPQAGPVGMCVGFRV